MSTPPKPRASLFATCLVDQLYPEVGVSTVRLLRRLGVEVDFPKDQTCCGQPLFNSGFNGEARKLAVRVLQQFTPPPTPPHQGGERTPPSPSTGEGQDGGAPSHEEERGETQPHYIVVPSGSCASMIRVFYPHLLQDDPQLHLRAQELAGRVYELSEFLVKMLGVADVGAGFEGTLTYHPSCHLLRELGVVDEPRELIRNVKGAQLVEMEQADTCCGFGGTFSVKYPHISGAMLEDKLEDLAHTGADTLVACDMSCLMHIGGALSRRGTGIRTMHLAQLLEPEGN